MLYIVHNLLSYSRPESNDSRPDVFTIKIIYVIFCFVVPVQLENKT